MAVPDPSYPDIAELDARFAGLAAEYGSRKAAAQATVVRWEWYSDDSFGLGPLYYERMGLRRGRRLARRPVLTRDHYQVGFDDCDRPVVLLEYSGFLQGKLYYETFRAYRDDAELIEEAHHYSDGRPIYLHECRVRDGLIRSIASAAIKGGGYEAYEYADGLPTRVAVYHATSTNKPDKRLNPLALVHVLHAHYDANGLHRLEKVWEPMPQPLVEVVYQRVSGAVQDQ